MYAHRRLIVEVIVLAIVVGALWSLAVLFLGTPMVPQHPQVGPCCAVASG